MSFGSEMKKRRGTLTKRTLGKRAGLCWNRVHQLEKNENLKGLRVGRFLRLAKVLHWPKDEMLKALEKTCERS